MPKSSLSSGHAFVLGVIALLVAVMCVTVGAAEQHIKMHIVMAVIWTIIAAWWLLQAASSRTRGKVQEYQAGNLER